MDKNGRVEQIRVWQFIATTLASGVIFLLGLISYAQQQDISRLEAEDIEIRQRLTSVEVTILERLKSVDNALAALEGRKSDGY